MFVTVSSPSVRVGINERRPRPRISTEGASLLLTLPRKKSAQVPAFEEDDDDDDTLDDSVESFDDSSDTEDDDL